MRYYSLVAVRDYRLTFQSLAVTLRNNMFKIKKILHADNIAFLCFVRISEQKANLAYTALTNWFL